MRCPKCGDEYRPGFTECADCRVPLVEDAAPDESPDERPEGHSEGPWAVLAQHSMDTAWVSLDSGSLALLELESELEAKGIDVGFDPFRPGEGGSFTRSLAQPIRLMVPASDLPLAREMASELGFDELLAE